MPCILGSPKERKWVCFFPVIVNSSAVSVARLAVVVLLPRGSYLPTGLLGWPSPRAGLFPVFPAKLLHPSGDLLWAFVTHAAGRIVVAACIQIGHVTPALIVR